jgi:hypothetical protein
MTTLTPQDVLRRACDLLQEERDEIFNSHQVNGKLEVTDVFTASANDRVLHFDAIIQAAQTAIAQIDAAMKDRARLDFLDRCNASLNAHYGTKYGWKMVMNHNVNRLMVGHLAVDLSDEHAGGARSCRNAIDGEMVRIGSIARQPPVAT